MVATVVATAAHAQAPAIARVSPGALRPGQSVQLTLTGSNLGKPTGLWTSAAAQTQVTAGVDKNGTLAGRVTFDATAPADTPVGIAALRIATPGGVSNLKFVMVDDLPSVAQSDNHTPATAQKIESAVAVDGVCAAAQTDYYRITAKAGQSLSVEVVAGRIGSALDPVISLRDATGHEIAFSDDEAGIVGDARFRCRFTADGEYLLHLRDVRHQGGATHFYRLRIGDFPLVTTPFPLAAQAGATATINAAGSAVENVAPVTLALPADATSGHQNISFRFAGGAASGFSTIARSATPQAAEIEPNNEPAQATKIAVPGGVSGRFEARGDRDWYEFKAAKGQRLVFAGRTRAVGSPSDLLLRITSAQGGGLGEAEDSGANEGELNVTFPADGVYRLSIEDLLRRSGPEFSYDVDVSTYQPGFALAIDTDKLDAPQQGTVAVKVTCARRDYGGPIDLAVETLPAPGAAAGSPIEGLTLENQTIPAGKNETELHITLPAQMAAGQSSAIRIIGRGQQNDKTYTDTASTLAALQKLMPAAPQPWPTLDGMLALGVGPASPAFFEIGVDAGPITLPQLVGQTQFKVRVRRLDGKFKAPLTIGVENLPAGVTAKIDPVGKGEKEYTVTLTAPDNIAEASTTFRITAEATHNLQKKRVALEQVPLAIVKPLAVTLSAAGPIAPGGQQKLKLTAKRFAAEKTPIALVWRKRPVGVTAPDNLTLGPEQSELEIPLTAAADAPLGAFADLILAATTKVKGQDVTVENPPATLEVKAAPK
jgi:hypothetical protein